MTLAHNQDRLRRWGFLTDKSGGYGPNTEAAYTAALDKLEALWPLPELVTPAIPPHPKIPMDLILGAMQAERTYGVPASVSLAQWALESGWGKSMPPGSNNPFGMKARANETGPVVLVETKEQRKDGSWYTIKAPFRKFADMGEAFEAHAKLVGTAPVYAPARAKLPNRDAYIDALGPIYATAKDYTSLIKSIIKSNNLAQYDRTVR
jgi:flagellum-specific peptidoglycan hydrolase FlgJ